MPSVWFINPRIVANLKALATRNRGGGKREQEDGRKGRGRIEGREGRRRRREAERRLRLGGENLLKISGVESTVGKVDEERVRGRGERWKRGTKAGSVGV